MTPNERKVRRRKRRQVRNVVAGAIYDDILFTLGNNAPTRMPNVELTVLLKLRRMLTPLFNAAEEQLDKRWDDECFRRTLEQERTKHAARALSKALAKYGKSIGAHSTHLNGYCREADELEAYSSLMPQEVQGHVAS